MENDSVVPKSLVWILGVVLIVLAGMYAIDKGISLAERAGNKVPPKNTMSMSAEGKVTAVPDLATLNVTVITQGTTAAGLQEENNTKVNKIVELVKAQGVDKKDIITSGPNIQPRYDYMSGRNNIVGYDAYQGITIKVRGLDQSTEKVGTILNIATENGVNQSSGVQYSFDDPDKYRQQARELAINKAKEKAQSLANTAGITLGKVVSVSESGGYYPSPVPMYGAAEDKAISSIAPERGSSPAIEPGVQEITASMTIIYEVK
jgi:uncharacterized protein